jgi:dipeptidyl aminopeptidase/acylaminoacyl peptidase
VLAPPEETEAEARRRRDGDDAYALGEQWRNHRVWIVTENGTARSLTDGRRHARAVQWSPDGRWVATITTPNPEADATEDARVEVIDVENGRAREAPDSAQASDVRWSPEGLLLITRPYDGRGISRRDVFAWSLDAPRPVNMTRVLDRDAEAVFAIRPGQIAVLHATGTTSAVATIDLQTGSVVDTWTTGAAVRHLEPAGDRWVMVAGDKPDEVVLVEGDATRPLTSWNASLGSALPLPVVETARWRSPAGAIEGVLYRPIDLVPGRRYPLIINPHGGPGSRSTASFDAQAAYFVSQGFLVLKPNFRGSTGYGDEFARANVGNWGEGPFRDVLSGVESLVVRGLVDPGRLFFYGWSYGGYLANWAVTHSDQLRAAVSGAGVADLRLQYAISDARRWRFDYFTATPFTAANLPLYERDSPITWARLAKTPTLFLHGERDLRCPLAQGLMMYRALQDNGVKTDMVIYPREGHSFVEPRHVIDRARRIVEWFTAHDTAATSRTPPTR